MNARHAHHLIVTFCFHAFAQQPVCKLVFCFPAENTGEFKVKQGGRQKQSLFSLTWCFFWPLQLNPKELESFGKILAETLRGNKEWRLEYPSTSPGLFSSENLVLQDWYEKWKFSEANSSPLRSPEHLIFISGFACIPELSALNNRTKPLFEASRFSALWQPIHVLVFIIDQQFPRLTVEIGNQLVNSSFTTASLFWSLRRKIGRETKCTGKPAKWCVRHFETQAFHVPLQVDALAQSHSSFVCFTKDSSRKCLLFLQGYWQQLEIQMWSVRLTRHSQCELSGISLMNVK